MKTAAYYLTLIILLFFSSINGQENKRFIQPADTVKNIFKINPFSILGNGRASIDYERYLGGRFSLNVGVSASNLMKRGTTDSRDFKELNMAVRYYFNKKRLPMTGMYISSQFTISNSTISELNYNGGAINYRARPTTVGASLLIGKQIINKKGFTLDMFTGLGVMHSQGKSYWGNTTTPFSTTGLNTTMGLKIGFGK